MKLNENRRRRRRRGRWETGETSTSHWTTEHFLSLLSYHNFPQNLFTTFVISSNARK